MGSQGTPQGVVAILIAPDGWVVAEYADFDTSAPGGYSQEQAQKMRAKRMVAKKTIDQACAPYIAKVLDQYHQWAIIDEMCRHQGFRLHIHAIGYDEEPRDAE